MIEERVLPWWIRIFVAGFHIAAIAARIVVGMTFLILLFIPSAPILVVLLPWRIARIYATNIIGTMIGRTLMWLTGCPITVEGREHLRRGKPAIFIGNHTSVVDAFTSIWLVPLGTVGVAKKQILNYPVYGQLWALSGHLVIDRSNTEQAKSSINELGEFVKSRNLRVMLWPEGTRSRDGRLQAFKKGFVHVAVATGLPIVPMITIGAQDVWEKGNLCLRRRPIQIKFLPPINTTGWTKETIDQHVDEVWQKVHDSLPPEQRPLLVE